MVLSNTLVQISQSSIDLEIPKEELEETIKTETTSHLEAMEAAKSYTQETGDVELQQATEHEIVKEKFYHK